MKNVFKIYKNDLKDIFTNKALLVIVIGLCILPSLYGWFNIKASWDPYSQKATSGIKVAIVNNDKGTKLNGKEINIGNQVVDSLKNNHQMGWQFVNEEEGTKNVESGNYYAMITIPENFTEQLTSIITSKVEKGDIIYTVNEKINAIAPKLTDKGASSIQQQVSKQIVATVSDAIFGVGRQLGITLENEIPKISVIFNSLKDVQSHFGDINDTIDIADEGASQIKTLITDLKNDIPIIEDTINNAKTFSSDLQDFIGTSKDGIDKISPTIKNDIGIINSISNEVGDVATSIKNAINSGTEQAPQLLNSLLYKVTVLENTTNGLLKLLNSLNNLNPNKPLNELIGNIQELSGFVTTAKDNINSILNSVNNGYKPDLSLLDNVNTLAGSVGSISKGIYDNFDTEIAGEISNIFNDANNLAQNALTILQGAEEKLPQVNDILTKAAQVADKGIEGIEYIKENVPKAEDMINNLISKIGDIKDNKDIQEVIDLLKTDIKQRSDFLSNPVNIIEKDLFPMGNYGTGMTPFYTVLSLWVGLLLLSSMLRVEPHGEYSIASKYFGKLMLYLSIAIIQALIVSLGDLFVLKIYCVNPVLFVLGSIFTSIIFTFIIYSLVSVFGSIGKVIGIVLLVLQLGGSGGTFPIQLTPKFFQVLYPFLPFTYAISFAREAIGGVVKSVLIKDIIVLLIFGVVFMLIALFLKKPINNLSKGFNESFEKSEIGE